MKPIAAFVLCGRRCQSECVCQYRYRRNAGDFDGSHQAASLSVENSDKVTNLVQSWVSPAEGSALKRNYDYYAAAVSPRSREKASIRIVRSGMPVPEDRESLLWLNVKGIPATDDSSAGKNTMQIAINSKIKLIYRPVALKGQSPESSANKVVWKPVAGGVQVNNPTPFYMNFSRIEINNHVLSGQYFVAPFSTLNISEGKILPRQSDRSLINDYGVKGQDKVSSY